MPNWTYFGHPAYRYRNEKGQWASDATVRAWGYANITTNATAVKTFAGDLSLGTLTVGQWEQQMRDAIKTEYITQYLLGKGGRNNMMPEDWGSIGGMIADQYHYLDNFASEVVAGKLSEAQIAMRSAMYIKSAKEAFERATARVRGILDMPAYPGDGNSRCLTNCRCYWSYRKRGDTWECIWNLMADENCEDCLDNASKWNPLVLDIGKKGNWVTIKGQHVFIGGPNSGGGVASSSSSDISQTTIEQVRNADISIRDEQNYVRGRYESYMVDIAGDDIGIMKPGSGDDFIFNAVDTADAECAAYEIAQALGYANMVPPTALREYEGKKVSLQAWVNDAHAGCTNKGQELLLDVPDSEIKNMLILDAVINNSDRHGDNYLLRRTASGTHLVAIDHGLAFSSDPSDTLPDYIPFARLDNLQFSASDFEPVAQLLQNSTLLASLSRSIGKKAVAAMRVRAQHLIDMETVEVYE